ncbi:MAG: indole-3-glycerol phosphate synthase TrpC [Syntrophotaleaceae bacterium]
MILDKILQHKLREVELARQQTPLPVLSERLTGLPAPRGFASALYRQAETGTAIIAEVKKGSPSKGLIRADFDAVDIALRYQDGGAACLSVLTDREFFMGDIAYLQRIAQAVTLPLLRKDFILDPYQLVEARVFGADAVLLIAAALDQAQLTDLAATAAELGLDVLLEVHDAEELERALRLPVRLIGINNRDLRTFHTDLGVTERLLPLIPPDRLVVSESGLRNRGDILRLRQAGARAFLIGESLMREDRFEDKLNELLGNRH